VPVTDSQGPSAPYKTDTRPGRYHRIATPDDYQAAVNAQITQNNGTIYLSVMMFLVYVAIAALTPSPSRRWPAVREPTLLRLADAACGQLLQPGERPVCG
jgi:hypothetical protein